MRGFRMRGALKGKNVDADGDETDDREYPIPEATEPLLTIREKITQGLHLKPSPEGTTPTPPETQQAPKIEQPQNPGGEKLG